MSRRGLRRQRLHWRVTAASDLAPAATERPQLHRKWASELGVTRQVVPAVGRGATLLIASLWAASPLRVTVGAALAVPCGPCGFSYPNERCPFR